MAVALKNDQRAHPLPAHMLTSGNGLGNNGKHLLILFFRPKETFQSDASKLRQHPPYLRLEQNDNGDQSNRQKLRQNKIQRVHVEQIGDPGNDQNAENHTGDPQRSAAIRWNAAGAKAHKTSMQQR